MLSQEDYIVIRTLKARGVYNGVYSKLGAKGW